VPSAPLVTFLTCQCREVGNIRHVRNVPHVLSPSEEQFVDIPEHLPVFTDSRVAFPIDSAVLSTDGAVARKRARRIP